MLGHDVRITDTTTECSDSDNMMPMIQLHGLLLSKARDLLTSKEFKALELLLMYDTPCGEIGQQLSKYKSREQGKPYALAIIQTALDRLSKLWGLK